MRATTQWRLGLAVIAMIVTCVTATTAQSVLETGRSISAELRDGQRVIGRVIAADSATITIETGGSPFVVNRASVAALSIRSYRPRPVKIIGITGAVVAGLFGMLVAGFCGDGQSRNCDDAFLIGAGIGAATGGIVMTSFATSIGAASPLWYVVPTSATVTGSTFSALSAPLCRRDSQWAAEVGAIQPRGFSGRVTGTYFCEPDVRSGIELGYLSRPRSGSTSHQDALETRYVAFVNERSLGHLPFDPRILTSIQYHNGNERNIDVHHDAAGVQQRLDRTRGANGLGFAVGASAGLNPARRTSVRVEERVLLIPGGMIPTLSVGAHWRP
jgi:hypothetical protein